MRTLNKAAQAAIPEPARAALLAWLDGRLAGAGIEKTNAPLSEDRFSALALFAHRVGTGRLVASKIWLALKQADLPGAAAAIAGYGGPTRDQSGAAERLQEAKLFLPGWTARK